MYEEMRSKGRETPLDRRPLLLQEAYPLWRAFTSLSAGRQTGMGPCPILLQDIVSYLDLYEIEDPDSRRFYFETVRLMDRVWMDLAEEDIKSRSQSPTEPSRVNRS